MTKFLKFNLKKNLLRIQNHLTNFSQTWRKASLGQGDSSNRRHENVNIGEWHGFSICNVALDLVYGKKKNWDGEIVDCVTCCCHPSRGWSCSLSLNLHDNEDSTTSRLIRLQPSSVAVLFNPKGKLSVHLKGPIVNKLNFI